MALGTRITPRWALEPQFGVEEVHHVTIAESAQLSSKSSQKRFMAALTACLASTP